MADGSRGKGKTLDGVRAEKVEMFYVIDTIPERFMAGMGGYIQYNSPYVIHIPADEVLYLPESERIIRKDGEDLVGFDPSISLDKLYGTQAGVKNVLEGMLQDIHTAAKKLMAEMENQIERMSVKEAQ